MKQPCNLSNIKKGNWVKFRNNKRAVVEHVNRFHATGLVDLHCRETNVTLHYQMTGAHFNDPEWDVCEINHTSPKALAVRQYEDESGETNLVAIYIDQLPSEQQLLELILELTPKMAARSALEIDRLRDNLKEILCEGITEFDVQNDSYYLKYIDAQIGTGHHFQYFSEL